MRRSICLRHLIEGWLVVKLISTDHSWLKLFIISAWWLSWGYFSLHFQFDLDSKKLTFWKDWRREESNLRPPGNKPTLWLYNRPPPWPTEELKRFDAAKLNLILSRSIHSIFFERQTERLRWKKGISSDCIWTGPISCETTESSFQTSQLQLLKLNSSRKFTDPWSEQARQSNGKLPNWNLKKNSTENNCLSGRMQSI